MPAKKYEPRHPEDPFNHINTALLKKGKISKVSVTEIPWHAFSTEPFEKKKAKDKEKRRRPEKIHPVLKGWIARRARDETELVMINFHDHLKIPRFPEPNTDEPRSSSANKKALKLATALVQEIQDRRADHYKRFSQELSKRYKARVLEIFWLVNSVLVRMPLGQVSALAKRDDVMYVEPKNPGEKPPQATPNDDVDDGRARIVSDPYFNLGLTGGFIGLLDTGLHFTHQQFNSPSTIAFRRDCVNGGANCTAGPGFDPTDDCWNHGTSTAAIITGNGRLGNPFRGVTAITLDSFKVYPAACGGLDTGAVVRAFQTAVAVLDE